MAFGTVAAIAGTASAVSSLMGDDGGGAATSTTREPWSAAQPWMRENIDYGRALQKFYSENPFSPQQQSAYQNIFRDLDSMRTGLVPGMMGIADGLLNTKYEMPRLSRPGTAGYGTPQEQATGASTNPQVQPRPVFSAYPGRTDNPNDPQDNVSRLYREVLSRNPEQGGFDFWTQKFGPSIDDAERSEFIAAARPELGQRGLYGPIDWRSMRPAAFTYGAPSAQGGLLGTLSDTSTGA